MTPRFYMICIVFLLVLSQVSGEAISFTGKRIHSSSSSISDPRSKSQVWQSGQLSSRSMPICNMPELPESGLQVDERAASIPKHTFAFSSNYCGGCNGDFYVGCKKVNCGNEASFNTKTVSAWESHRTIRTELRSRKDLHWNKWTSEIEC